MFAQMLAAEARRRDMAQNPFVVAVADGSCPREVLQEWACDTVAMSRQFIFALCRILSLADHPAVRRSLLHNLLEEEGVVSYTPGGSMHIDPEMRHNQLAQRMARALGATDEQLGATTSVSGYVDRELDAGRWIGPLAFLTVGIETSVPPTFRTMFPALQSRYGLSARDAEFVAIHFEADERHCEEGVAMVSAVATTDALRAEALQGARKGAATWWHFHSGRMRAVRPALSTGA